MWIAIYILGNLFEIVSFVLRQIQKRHTNNSRVDLCLLRTGRVCAADLVPMVNYSDVKHHLYEMREGWKAAHCQRMLLWHKESEWGQHAPSVLTRGLLFGCKLFRLREAY